MTSSNIVTDLIPSPVKKGYVDVYADGELALTVSEDTLLQAELRVGEELNTQRLEEIEHTSALVKAKAKAYDYLSYGDLSKDALFKKLTRYGISQEIADETCNTLESEGYIDDMRYGAAFANYLADTKLYGPMRIKRELTFKGISSEILEIVISELETDFDKSILTLIDKKFNYDLTDRKGVSKLFAALLRYGYDYETISSALSGMENEYE